MVEDYNPQRARDLLQVALVYWPQYSEAQDRLKLLADRK